MKDNMLSRTNNVRETAKIIADRMLELRPKGKVEYFARRNPVYVRDNSPLGAREVDLYKLFPDAKAGDFAYVSVLVESETEFEAVLKCSGASRVFIDGVECELSDGTVSYLQKAGRVTVELECIAGDEFKVSFTPSIKYYPGMLAKDYLCHISMLCPKKEYDGEEGVAVSDLNGKRGEWKYPEPPAKNDSIDFTAIYPKENGIYAYALMYAENTCNAEFDFKCKAKIIVNSKEEYFADKEKITFELSKDDFVLVKCEKGDEWSFEYKGEFYLPFISKTREYGINLATAGTFGVEEDINIKYGPELYFDLKTPYINADGKKCFLKLSDCDDYVVADMRTYFYAQWFYALMVGEYGLLDASRITGDDRYKEYFIKSMSDLADFYELQKWQMETFGESAFLQRGMMPEDWDAIGTIGMNLCELYKLVQSENAKEITEFLEKRIDVIPRFDDTTFHRGDTMWSDDTYMSCMFMLRYALMKNDRRWSEECVRQLLGFKKKLFMEDEGIFSHIYFVNEKTPNRIPWGRGNGWVFITMSEVLETVPKDIEGYKELEETFKVFAQNIIRLQGKNGMWHQVLNNHKSYEETSCTGMYIIGLCRAIRLGLLNDSVKENIQKAYEGLMTYKIDDKGNIFDVCRGSSCSMEEKYYINLGTVDNDDHGTGIILSALYQISKTL